MARLEKNTCVPACKRVVSPQPRGDVQRMRALKAKEASWHTLRAGGCLTLHALWGIVTSPASQKPAPLYGQDSQRTRSTALGETQPAARPCSYSCARPSQVAVP